MSELLQFCAPIDLQAAAGDGQKPKRFSMLAYGGGLMSPAGWPNVVVDLAGADVSGDIPILAGHAQDLDSVVGKGQASVRNNGLYVEGSLTDATPAGQKVLALNRDGIGLQASIGFFPDKLERVSPRATVAVNGRTLTAGEQGLTIIRSGKLREVSLLPVGADPNTQVQISASLKGNRNMEDTTTTQTPNLLTAEHNRVATITAMCDATVGRIGEILPDRLKELRASAINENWTKEKTELELLRAERDAAELQRIRSERPKGPMIHSSSRDIGGAKVLEGALLAHLGHEDMGEKLLGARTMEVAKSLRCTHMLDIVKASLRDRGDDIPADKNAMLKAAFSTMSLPGILSNVANKMMEAAYKAFPSVARTIAKKLSANDFKQHTGFRLTGDMKFEEVTSSGEIAHGQLAESSYSYRVKTYAKLFSLTRVDIINDDLGAFDSMPQIIGRGAAVMVEELFWQLVLANTGSFFAEGNGNYISDATTSLGIEGLRQAVQAMREQTDAAGVPVLVEPKFLVVPPALEATADTLYTSTNIIMDTDTATPDGNPYKGKYQPLVVPHLGSTAVHANASPDAWYLFGNPVDVAAFGLAYLSGQESPTVESADADFSTLGVQFRGFLDVGACQIDPKGGVMSAGK